MSPNAREKPHWSPNTDVFVSRVGHLIIKVDLSGLHTKDLELTVEGRRLKIKGARRDSELDDAKVLLVDGIPGGPFESVLEIPDGYDLSASRADYLNGVLRIDVPREASTSENLPPRWN